MCQITVLKGAVLINNALIEATEKPQTHICYNATRLPIYAIWNGTEEFKSYGKDIKLNGWLSILMSELFTFIKKTQDNKSFIC